MSNVIENLKEAIKEESNSKRKYELFEEQAVKEKLVEVAQLFKAIIQAEGYHLSNHLKALSKITKSEVNLDDIVKLNEEELKNSIKDTKTNLQNAYDSLISKVKVKYKEFLKNAKINKSELAELTFDLAIKTKRVHARLLSLFLKKLEKKKPLGPLDIYTCSICGNLELKEPTTKCKICFQDPEHYRNFYFSSDY